MSKKKLKKITEKEDCLDGQDDKVGTAVLLLLSLLLFKTPQSREENELFSSFVIESNLKVGSLRITGGLN